jgi:phage terminase large subunit-like protein
MSLVKISPEKLEIFANLPPIERRKAGEINFAYFFTYYFAPYVNYKYADFHYDFFEDCHDLLEGKINEGGWIAFRESAKTSIAKAFVAYLICYDKRKYINVDSYSKENAERILFDVVLELQTNRRILADFGELYNAKRKQDEVTQKRVSNFVTTNGVRVEAHSTQEPVRGRLSRNNRPDCVILDDFETDKTIVSEPTTLSIRNHIEEFQGGLSSNAIVLYLGNYISEFGNVEWLFKRAKDNPKIRMRNVPVMINDIPTWPSKYCLNDSEATETGKVSIESIRNKLYSPDTGHKRFMAEMMNEPVDESTQVFKRHMFQYKPFEEVLEKETNCFLLVDTAVSQQKESDSTGFSLVFVDRENNWYVKAWADNIDPKNMINNLFALNNTYNLTQIGIEKTIFYDVIKPFLDEEMRKRNVYLNIVGISHGGKNKEERIRWLIPRYEAKSIYHITGETKDLENELLRFPNSLHDDVMDSLAYATKIAYSPVKSRSLAYEAEEKPLYNDIGL